MAYLRADYLVYYSSIPQCFTEDVRISAMPTRQPISISGHAAANVSTRLNSDCQRGEALPVPNSAHAHRVPCNPPKRATGAGKANENVLAEVAE